MSDREPRNLEALNAQPAELPVPGCTAVYSGNQDRRLFPTEQLGSWCASGRAKAPERCVRPAPVGSVSSSSVGQARAGAALALRLGEPCRRL